jgi:hypothetical protein
MNQYAMFVDMKSLSKIFGGLIIGSAFTCYLNAMRFSTVIRIRPS